MRCEKEESNTRNWTIAVELTLTLVSANGRILTSSTTSFFNKPVGYGLGKVMRWDDMLEKYVDNDRIRIEVRGKITEMTGCDGNNSSNCVIS